MIYISLIDLVFMLLGMVIGIAIMAVCAASGQRKNCEECIRRYFNEREEKILAVPEE